MLNETKEQKEIRMFNIYKKDLEKLSIDNNSVRFICIEYLCSFFQEMLFGSTSWDYSNIPFNLNGRICLLYSVFWGILGILWIKEIYPRMAVWILKIPNKVGKISKS